MPSEISQTLVFFGIHGSGKGTQVKLLIEYLKKKTNKDTVYAYPGDEYRKLAHGNTYTGVLVKDPLSQGYLLPGFLTDAIITNILVRDLTEDKHIITDGYPREISQSKSFEEMMSFFKRDNIKIVYIDLSETEATRRNLLRGRHDDTEEGLRKRFHVFKNSVLPAMNYFRGKKGYQIYNINGEQSIEDVHKEIISTLEL